MGRIYRKGKISKIPWVKEKTVVMTAPMVAAVMMNRWRTSSFSGEICLIVVAHPPAAQQAVSLRMLVIYRLVSSHILYGIFVVCGAYGKKTACLLL